MTAPLDLDAVPLTNGVPPELFSEALRRIGADLWRAVDLLATWAYAVDQHGEDRKTLLTAVELETREFLRATRYAFIRPDVTPANG